MNFDSLDHSVSLTFFGCLQSLQRERCKSVERTCTKHNSALVEEQVPVPKAGGIREALLGYCVRFRLAERVASAVDEGSMAVRFVHQYLADSSV